MEHSVVFGNGPSRLEFDFHAINAQFVTYGCNAFYRDYIPDVLVSMDIHMVTEIINARVHHKTHFVTQHINDIDLLAGNGEPIHFIRTLPSTPDSGTAAIQYAVERGHFVIYIVGFDYYNGTNNNVYAGTANYNNKNFTVPDSQTMRWKQRLQNIINTQKNVKFIIVGNNTGLQNATYITSEQFKEIYSGI